MSNIISRFVAGRMAAKPQHEAITNQGQTVSRAEFMVMQANVATLSKAIEGLIEDFDTVASPEKLEALVNAAFDGIKQPANGRPSLALKAEGGLSKTRDTLRKGSGFLAPAGDDDEMRVNKGHNGRPPLALPADDRSNIRLAPQGD